MTSFWRNRKQYRFFMVALTLSTLVLSLGLSAVDVMSNIWRLPSMVSHGGHIFVSPRVPTEGAGVSTFRTFSRTEISSLIVRFFPDALLTYSLTAPSHPLSPLFMIVPVSSVTGREGGLDTWYLSPLIVAGEQMHEDNAGRQLFYIRQAESGRIPEYTPQEAIELPLYDQESASWSFRQPLRLHPSVAATTKWPARLAFTHLNTLQQLVQAPLDLVSEIGIALPGVHAKIDADKLAEWRAALQTEFPELEATTIDEYVAELGADLEPLRDAAKRYVPIVLGISLMVVVATALAVIQSRRQELGMLRVIGMSAGQVRVLFLLEAALSTLLACSIGLLLSKLASYMLFCRNFGTTLIDILKTDVSLVPFGLSLLITLAVLGVASTLAVSRTMTSALRNA